MGGRIPKIRAWGLERRIASALEEGASCWGCSALAHGWAWAARRERRHGAIPGAFLLGIEGATLGGSYKTPCALALAEALAQQGVVVGYWARGYGGSRGGWNRIKPTDLPGEVGDEAVLAARRLAYMEVPVFSGAPEQALAELAKRGGVIVADSLRVAHGEDVRAVLTLDEERPWGAGWCPPAGDLRAPPSYLLKEASAVLTVGSEPAGITASGRWRVQREMALASYRGVQAAVVTAIARPQRFLHALKKAGVFVERHVALPDHGGSGAAKEAAWQLRESKAEVILCTEKCALWLPPTLNGIPVESILLQIKLPDGWLQGLGIKGCERG